VDRQAGSALRGLSGPSELRLDCAVSAMRRVPLLRLPPDEERGDQDRGAGDGQADPTQRLPSVGLAGKPKGTGKADGGGQVKTP
jgi:hypothetical protein